jgi:phosphate starvation-inducible membrane PsiE
MYFVPFSRYTLYFCRKETISLCLTLFFEEKEETRVQLMRNKIAILLIFGQIGLLVESQEQ